MTNTKDIIIKLKDVRDEKGLSYNDILSLTSAKRLAAKQAEEQRNCKNNVLKELGKHIE